MDIENKTTFAIGLIALGWAIVIDVLNVIIASHFWPVCAFTYIAALFLLYDGIKGERPNIWISLIMIIGVFGFVLAGMYIMSTVNGVELL